MRIGIKAFVLAAAFGAATVAGVRDSSARGPFDGVWNVTFQPTAGECSSSFWIGVRIVDGRLYPAGSGGGFTLAGTVNKSGVVRASVSNGSDAANGTGRLARAAGRGNWAATSGRCVGVWSAVRGG